MEKQSINERFRAQERLSVGMVWLVNRRAFLGSGTTNGKPSVCLRAAEDWVHAAKGTRQGKVGNQV